MAVRTRGLEEASEGAWDAFVSAMPEGTFFHRTGWRHVIARAFGHRHCYRLAEQDGAIVGVLPLVHLRTRLFGSRLVSVPFCVYGGPLAADSEALEALEGEAARLLRSSAAQSCEFRFLHAPAGASWPTGPTLYETFRKPLERSEEAILKAIPRKQRAVVRKGIANGLSARCGRDADAFFPLYAESVRNLGTPVFPRRYFRLLIEAFPEEAEVLTVEDGGKPIAAVLSFVFRNEILPYYAGGSRAARGRAAHDFMYWELMRRAAARGIELFDFGRSKIGTGAHAFKKNWGFVSEPLQYRMLLAPGQRIPQDNPLNPKYRRLIAAWKWLPLPLANLLGPHIVRGIG